MNTRLILSGAAAFLCAGVLSSAQIAPQGGTQRAPQPTPSQPRTTASDERPSTFAGCLYREDAIPGRSPNVAEKAGVLEDYILADATIAPSSAPDRQVAEGEPARPGQTDPARPGQPEPRAGQPTAGAAAGLATGRMYKVTKIPDDRLKTLIGKRVEVTGTVKPDGDVQPGEKPVNFENLPNIEATAIREASGATCPSRPAGTSPATPAPSPNR
jgi:hypothetical protein